jgi:glycosyltransferase involved in cell wall biosynthesis
VVVRAALAPRNQHVESRSVPPSPPQIAERALRPRVCSIAAKNYLGSVTLLAQSLARFHPAVPMSVLLVDGVSGETYADLPFEIVLPADLPIDENDFLRMATYYDVTELATALKATLLLALLDDGDDVVVYLDPDIEIFAPIEHLFRLSLEHEIALTPHVLRPVPRDGLAVTEEAFLLSGQFNLGFVGVSAAARPFLEYWEERTRLFAVRDPSNGYFTDQRWVDAVPSLFPHFVLRTPADNVAYWNLHERTLEFDAQRDRWTVDDEDLAFFHFSGHDASNPYLLSAHIAGQARMRVDEDVHLRRLLRERSERIDRSEPELRRAPYGWSRTSSGVTLTGSMRRVYWHAVREAHTAGAVAPPHPFGADGGRGFLEWLGEPATPRGTVDRYTCMVWQQRVDLQRAFPDPMGADAAGLTAWAASDADTSAQRGTVVPVDVVGAPGVNVVGFLDGEFGVGAAGRMLARAVRAAGLPLATKPLHPPFQRHQEQHGRSLEGAPFPTSVFAMNADGLLAYSRDLEFLEHRGKKRVGIWYWEAGQLPASMCEAASLVDEVWCASSHVRDLLAASLDVPVFQHPLVFDAPRGPSPLTRADLGLPSDGFLFGFVFDFLSVPRRKNPTAVVDAYCAAFGPDDGAKLLLKSMHGMDAQGASSALREAAGGRPDVVFIDRHFDPIEMRALFEQLDCYVSLHRSEGLGLTMSSAMAAGTPCIATGWSGNLEFMHETNSYLVPYELVEIGPGADPYAADGVWAEPDVEAAAAAMRRMFDHPEAATELGRRGRESLVADHTAARAASWLAGRIDTLTGGTH